MVLMHLWAVKELSMNVGVRNFSDKHSHTSLSVLYQMLPNQMAFALRSDALVLRLSWKHMTHYSLVFPLVRRTIGLKLFVRSLNVPSHLEPVQLSVGI